MIAVFVALGTSLSDSGLTSSLIRTPEADDEDFSTIFFTNLGLSIIIYFIVYLLAPTIAEFFDQPILTPIVRVYCLTFVIKAFSAVQSTRLTTLMDFKTQMIVQLPALVISGIFGIVLAYKNFGVWSLVYMYLLNAIISTIHLWIKTGWRPTFIFSLNKLKYHFDFGYKLTLSGVIDTIYQNIYNIVIGKYFTATQLGYYTRAQTMKQLPVNNISSALSRVTYPMFSSIRDDQAKLKSVYRRLMEQVLFWVAPILTIAGVLAEPLFRFVLTEKWLPAVPYFQILCVVGTLYPIQSYNLNILKVKGRSDLFLRLEIVKKLMITVGLLIAVPLGIYALLWMQVILSIVAFFVNSYYSGLLIDYSTSDQIRDLFPIVLVSLIVGSSTFILDRWIEDIHDFWRLLIGAFVGMLAYLSISNYFKIRALLDFRGLILHKI